jgi:hypothetical protein
MESIYTDDQTYGAGDQLANAKLVEPTLGTENVTVTVAGNGAAGYTITAKNNSTNHVFTLAKDAATGVITRTCLDVGKGGCPSDGTW